MRSKTSAAVFPTVWGIRFRRLASGAGTDRTGLGLGLSIAREAVRAHGGEIDFHNVHGKGCVFTIDLPLVAEAVPVSPVA